MDYRIQLTDVEAVHRLLSFDDNLSQAYRYYQDLILAVSHRDQGELNQLLSQKWTTLPWPLQKVQRTLRSHKLEIINSFKYQNYTNGPVEGTNNKIKVIKRTAYGFCNFFNFWARSTGTIKEQLMPNSRHELLENLFYFLISTS
nr:transposase [Fructilactobacillus sanfranciscensis]